MEKIRKNLEIEVEAIVTSFTDYLHSIMLSAPYELQIELVIGIIGSILFIGLLLYRLKHGKRINNGDCCIQKW